jgi:prevent-host-death family protein
MIRVSASQLKAKLGQYMRAVREGKEILVTDRDHPVARLLPVEAPAVRHGRVVSQPRDPAAPRLGAVRVRAIAFSGTDTLALLGADRARR